MKHLMAIVLLALVLTAGSTQAAPPVLTPGWEAFVIREASDGSSGPPLILDNDVYATDAVEMVVFAGGQKAGLGTDALNGVKVSQIATLHIDRLDDPADSGSLYGPYFNIWVTDGLGNYAVIANEPSNPEWAGSRWDVADWDFLKTKTMKVYETPGWNSGTSWVHNFVGSSGGLTFADVAELIIEPPSPAYIANAANGVGSGAPDILGTNGAYGFNWIFGDTLANYVSGAEGFVVNNYSTSASFPVNNTTQGIGYGTIEGALAAAAPYDVITVADGSYSPSGTLSVNKALTLTGQSEAGVVINIPAPGGYGIAVAAGDVILENFTLAAAVANENYPIHASGTSNPPNGFDNLTLRNITVSGAHRRTGIDVHGYNNLTLSNLTSSDATGGNGVQITGCVGVTVDNVTTLNNAWGSFAIYCSNSSYLNRGSSGVVIDGASCTFGEGTLFSQDEFGLANTGITVSGYGYLVRNFNFRPDAAGYTFFQDTEANAVAQALGLDTVAPGSFISLIGGGSHLVAAGMGIQFAIDGALPGDVINVQAGHFEEQLHIAKDNLTLTGAGTGLTFVDAPAAMPLFFATANNNFPVVFVDGAAGTAISGLTIDGQGNGAGNYRFVGLGLHNADGSYSNLAVTRLRDEPLSGSQHGIGLYVINDDAVARVVNFTDVAVTDIQKNGASWDGSGLEVNAVRVNCTGNGPLGLGLPAQNGIQVSGGANGFLTDCVIADYHYTEPAWTATGLLSFGPGMTTATGTTITGCKTSVYFIDGSGSLDGCTVTNPLGDPLYAYSTGAKAAMKIAPQPVDSPSAAAMGNKAALAVGIYNSTFTGNDVVDSWGVTAYAAGPVDFTVAGCTIENFDYGLCIYEDGGMVTGAAGGNLLAGNLTYGGWSNSAVPFDMRGNDWGDPTGPFSADKNPGGLGDGVSNHILFTPWIGRTVGPIADIGVTPDGPYFWESTPGIGVDGDFAPGFGPGCLQAPNAYSKYGFSPDALFGRSVNVGELYSITYYTKKDLDHVAEPVDWFFQMYTAPYEGSPGSTWYGNRINSEPYFAENLTEVAGDWNQWVSAAGQNNRLRFYDSSSGYFGSYTDGFLVDLTNDDAFAAQPVMVFDVGLGTAWADAFDGLIDGVTIELVSGEKATVNFISGNAFVGATPSTNGPLACGEPVTLTFSLETDAYTPDIFGYNAIVRATGEVDWSTITDLQPFGTTTNFFAVDNGDGSWDISATTLGSPNQPVSTPGSHDLFSVEFIPAVDGVADITFDLLQLRDPDNAPIPAVGTGATITVDCTAPAPVTAMVATPGHNKVDVSWTHDLADVDHFEVHRGLWYDTTVGVSAYPEYDDLAGSTIPTRPTGYGVFPGPAGEWVMVDGGTVVTVNFTDAWLDANSRGVYYYEVFAVDAAGNGSAVAAANDRATNYWLGDVVGVGSDPVPNGLVQSYDMNALGAAFGRSDGEGGYNNVVDVGPTDNWSRLGIPLTDSLIDFEDLMVFSMNFGIVGPAKTAVPMATVVDLAWVRYDDGRQALRLVDGSGVKGLNVRANVNVSRVEAGELLDEQTELTFLKNVGDQLDVSVAVTGLNTGFAGTGDLFVVDAEALVDLKDLTIKVRGYDNSRLEFRMNETSGSLTPRVFGLNPNYPNPFNPMTKISFTLPESQSVRLAVYGVDGRLVATLLDEVRGPGLHEVVWTGQDDRGQQAASGLYFYRVEAGPYSQVRKMTLMK